MKFRIIKYYDNYKAQVLKKEGVWDNSVWDDIGWYYSIEGAKDYCRIYKEAHEGKIVEEFEI